MIHKALNDGTRFTGAHGRAGRGGGCGGSGGGAATIGPVGAAVGLQGHTNGEGPHEQDDNTTKPHLLHSLLAYKRPCDDPLA